MSEKTCRKRGHTATYGGLSPQRGNTVLIVLVVVVALMAALIFAKERSRAAAKAEQQRIELVERQEAERVQREKDAAARREREALEAQEKKAAQEKSDLLAASLKKYDDVVVRFYDASRVAGGTGRIALAQPVATMQALHREAAQLVVPPCLSTGRDDLVDAMKETVDAYIVFMQNRDKLGDVLASGHFGKAEKSIERYRSARSACPAL